MIAAALLLSAVLTPSVGGHVTKGDARNPLEIPESERSFIRELRSIAAVKVERFMRERHQAGKTTPREEELYKAFQEQLSAKSEVHRFNLRGGWLFAKPGS